MPFASVKLIPGVNVERTESLNETGYTATEHGRFRDGLFQKLGGWTKFRPFSYGYGVSSCTAYQDLNNVRYLAFASEANLHVITDNSEYDLTPRRLRTNPTPDYSTVLGSDIITIVDTGITTVEPFDAVVFYTPVSVGGVILSGMYQINSYVALNTYTIKAQSVSTATVNHGGAVPVVSTTAGSSTATITLADHGRQVGDIVVFDQNTTSVGGIQFTGIFKVFDVVDSSHFSVVFNTTAGSTASQSMPSDLYYYLAIGPIAAAQAYGSGNYSDGLYGLGVSPTISVGTPYTAAYSLSAWGDVLIAGPIGRPLNYWDSASGFSTVQPIGNGPLYTNGSFISQSTQILVAYGSTTDLRIGNSGIGMYRDNLLIQWSDQENFLDWTPTDTNFAGSYKLPSGTRILSGLSTPTRDLIWTDIELWGMTFTGYPYTFSVTKLGVNCGIVGRNAACLQAGVVYWMGSSNFFIFDGSSVHVIPCPIWDVVFQNLNTVSAANCFVVSNTPFNEVWFFYPSGDGVYYPNKYVKYNTVEGTWDYGTLSRSAGIDQSVWGSPIYISSDNGIIYTHESGQDDAGSVMISSMDTGYFTLSDSQEIVFVDRILPDFKYGFFGSPGSAQISITVTAQNHPTDTPRVYGPFAAAAEIPCRIRGRLLKLHVESADAGSFWRLGRIRFRYAPDGRV